jgi:hypothetical protein
MNRIEFKILLIGFILIAVQSFADRISAPPPLPEEPVAEQHYFKEIYDNFHRLEVTTTNPDGSRNGKKGDMLLSQTGGKHYLEINTNSSTTWHGVELTDTP